MFILYCFILALMFVSAISWFTKISSNKCLLVLFLDITIVGGILWVGPEIQGSKMYLFNLIAWSAISLVELLAFLSLSRSATPRK